MGHVAACCVLAALLPGVARAQTTRTVNTTQDPAGPGCTRAVTTCSIRQALAASIDGDTIVIPAGSYQLTQGQLLATSAVSMQGAGAETTTISASTNGRVVEVDAPPGTATTIAGLTLTGGSLTGAPALTGGGGLYLHTGALTLQGVVVTGNSASSGEGGGGVFDDSAGALALTNSSVTANKVSLSAGGLGGGGILAVNGPLTLTNTSVLANAVTLSAATGAAGGGGIYDDASTAAISESTIAHNAAAVSAAQGSNGGGGIYDASGPSRYLNDTLSANAVAISGPGASGSGGGALFHNGAAGTISDTTIAGNSTSTSLTGGGIFNSVGAYTVKNTIVADNSSECAGPGAIVSAGFNLDSGTSCGFTMPSDLQRTEPRLGPLAANGGPTSTQAPTPASPAIDAGSCSDATGAAVATDQRGIARPQPAGGRCDIGAVEFVPASPVPDIVGGSRPSVDGSTQADFAGVVNPDGPLTTVRFEYGLDARYRPARVKGSIYDHLTPPIHIGPGYAPTAVSASAAGLVPAALYHVRLIAVNGAGRAIGPDQTFVTFADRKPPRPVLGRNFNATPISGLVRVRIGGTFVPLTEVRQLPLGTLIDAQQGMLLASATGARGGTEMATTSGGVFKITQTGSGHSRGQVGLSLVNGIASPRYSSCHGHTAQALQTLHAIVSGNFRISARFSVASTARSGQWATSDRCDGTFTSVHRGPVLVSDLSRHRTVIVRSGRSYLAKRVH